MRLHTCTNCGARPQRKKKSGITVVSQSRVGSEHFRMLRRCAHSLHNIAYRRVCTTSMAHMRNLRRHMPVHVREAELRREIAQLEQQWHDLQKRDRIKALTRDLPPLEESTLDSMYQELVSSPLPDVRQLESPPPTTPKLSLEQLAARLGLPPVQALPKTGDTSTDTTELAKERKQLRAQILERLERSGVELCQQQQTEASDLSPCTQTASGIVSPSAWLALAIQSARDHDTEHVNTTLALAARSGMHVSPLFHKVMDAYANAGLVEPVLELSAAMQANGILPQPETKHIVVKAYAKMNQLFDAVQYLSLWEQSDPAPMSSYTLVIEHVLKHPIRDLHPIAWSLFYHMRYAAHPVPDAPLYAMMIRACAAGIPQPNTMSIRRNRSWEADAERALDLFREMTVHHGIRPNKEVYDSLILTCARRKEHYSDALRLLRELVDGNAHGVAPLSPDVYTYNAVLQGSARKGDLITSRWILADMVRSVMTQADSADGTSKAPNEETLTNVFWSYAVYRPPIKRSDLVTVQAEASPHGSENDKHAILAANEEQRAKSSNAQPSFSQNMPQTSSDVLMEARSLMARILADQGHSVNSNIAVDLREHPMRFVAITPRLLNAFLAVFTHHMKPDQRLRALFNAVYEPDGVFAQSHVQANGHTLAMVLAECTLSKDRAFADQVAEQIWEQWTTLEGSSLSSQNTPVRRDTGTDAKTISKMWALMIRQHAKSFRVEPALTLLRSFLEKYPPSSRAVPKTSVTTQAPLPQLDWMPIVPPMSMLRLLYSLPPGTAHSSTPSSSSSMQSRPSLPLPQSSTSASTSSYSPLSPLRPKLLFRDLELLHHRCVALHHVAGLNLITRVDREYRREW